MEKQKLKRVLNATIIGAILLVVVLVFVLVYQLVKIGNEKRDIQELKDKIAYYQTLTEAEKNDLVGMNTKEWIEQRARELGFVLEGDYALD